jgi:uncharacterized protein
MIDIPPIVAAIFSDYPLPLRGYHGVVHWARVFENGLRIAEANGADVDVVMLFALFHDARRINEDRDHGHGQRGGDFAKSLRGTLVHRDDHRFDLLYEACRLHTDGHTEADPTIQACWDADRLDLGRVGVKPARHRLCTDAARGLLNWAHARAERGYEPVNLLKHWGVDRFVPRRT